MINITIDQIIYNNCVRYDRLRPIIADAFAGSNATQLNIYIDMYPLYTSIFSRTLHTKMDKDTNTLVAGMVNMCAHYRAFFRYYLGVETKFFIISSTNTCDVNRKFVYGYNQTMIDKIRPNIIMQEYVMYNIDLLDILCPYLPDIFFIPTDFESSVVASYIIEKEMSNGNTNPNLILTRDAIYNMQLVAMYSNTAILRPYKFQGEDLSYIIPPLRNRDEFWYWFHYCNKNIKDNVDIAPINLSLVLALSRLPTRCIKGVLRIDTAKNAIFKTIGSSDIKCTVESVCNTYNTRVAEQVVFSKWKAIDILFQRAIFDETAGAKMIKLRNLEDPDTVKEINGKYFYNNPLDLDRL